MMVSYADKDTRVRRQQALASAVSIADGRGYTDDQVLRLAKRLEHYIISGDIGDTDNEEAAEAGVTANTEDTPQSSHTSEFAPWPNLPGTIAQLDDWRASLPAEVYQRIRRELVFLHEYTQQTKVL